MLRITKMLIAVAAVALLVAPVVAEGAVPGSTMPAEVTLTVASWCNITWPGTTVFALEVGEGDDSTNVTHNVCISTNYDLQVEAYLTIPGGAPGTWKTKIGDAVWDTPLPIPAGTASDAIPVMVDVSMPYPLSHGGTTYTGGTLVLTLSVP